ncbi:MAG TPA: inositol monophosphatase [Anaerohalosphaeraceae bacterium]|jgi:myo-inositol-1(or 4)-monophosphatase|nr:inositol monophosphatase [Anaerohalosphaeraceae bacterium]
MRLSRTEISAMLETAVVAARLAGQRALEEILYIRTTRKSPDELVTQADPICQKVIIDQIKEMYPDHGFVAEEGPDGKMFKLAPRGDQPIWWVIDPIDGTNNFANGVLCFSVSVAAMLEGRPVVGVIFDPATESMYTAAEDVEAQINGTRIQVNQQEINRFSCFGVDSYLDPSISSGLKIVMSKTRFRCLGSTALQLAYVAKGAMIGAVTTNSRLWDFAAGTLLIERAGGYVSTVEGQSLYPIYPQEYEGQMLGVLAANAVKKEEIQKLFRE